VISVACSLTLPSVLSSPAGKHLEWEVIGTFRYDDTGRLAEEWVQTDYRSFLSKLGVTVTESANDS
jgi:hypothetical protein